MKSCGRLLPSLLSYLVAAGCLFWVVRGVHLEPLLRSLGGIQWRWIVLAILLEFLAYLCAAMRWRCLLRPVGRLRLGRATQAYYAGLFRVGKSAAAGFGLLTFAALEAPLWIVGFFCLAQSGASLRQIRNRAGNGPRRAEPD